MMKKWTALLLSLVLGLTLLPTAALAEGTTPAAGVYLNQDMTGECITALKKDDEGPTAYWNIPYSDAPQNVVYYYNEQAECLTNIRNKGGITIEAVPNTEHFWKITLTGTITDLIDLAVTDNGEQTYCFQFVYQPEKGLYYKGLQGIRDDNPYVDADEPYSNTPIQLSPYVDRMDIAVYFYDGRNYTPVDVTFDKTLSVDPVNVKGQTGWYMFAAYDFCNGTMSYTHEGITYYLNVSTHLPDYGFYVKGTAAASEKAYRMYTIAEENTSTDERYSKYRFSKTLTFMPSDPQKNLGLGPNSGIEVRVTCQQRQYLPNGSEVDSIDYNDFAYSWEAGDNTIELTLYTDDSDVLCFLTGTENGSSKFGTYVNVLAPVWKDGAYMFLTLRANDLGSPAAAKFLPKHIFKEAAEQDLGVTLSVGDYAANVTFDADQTAAMADATNAALEVKNAQLSNEQSAAITAANANATVQGAVDITLAYGKETQHELDGTATVSYPCELDLADGAIVQVYYVYTEDGVEKTERIAAAYDAENGCVTFTTDHFSTFVIVTTPAPGTSGGGSSASTYSVTAPKAANGTVKVSPRYAEKGDTVTLTVTPDEGYTLETLSVTDKNGNALELKNLGNGKYSFKMPTGKVTVTASFMDDNTMLNFFVDVPADQYYYDAVLWAAKNGITGGMDDTHFIPNSACTRAQIVTFLYRWAVANGVDVSVGEDTNILSYNDAFTVPEYAVSAFQWAVGAGIVQDSNGDLMPNQTCTRAQAVTFLFRFAVANGMDFVTLQELVSGYADAASVPGYALSAFNWALAGGIVTGNNGALLPNNDCTRAQIVTFLYRLLGE